MSERLGAQEMGRPCVQSVADNPAAPLGLIEVF